MYIHLAGAGSLHMMCYIRNVEPISFNTVCVLRVYSCEISPFEIIHSCAFFLGAWVATVPCQHAD